MQEFVDLRTEHTRDLRLWLKLNDHEKVLSDMVRWHVNRLDAATAAMRVISRVKTASGVVTRNDVKRRWR